MLNGAKIRKIRDRGNEREIDASCGRIVSIIVAYNAAEDVLACARRVAENSDDPIVVVDNSDPPLESMLPELDELPVPVHYLKAKANFGSASGFALGMRYGIDELCADWLWLHDQDGYPSATCLAGLKRTASSAMLKVGVVAPVVRVCETDSIHPGFRAKMNWLANAVSLNDGRLRRKTWRDLDVAGSAGLLISSECINDVGTYDCNFFVGHEDYEFCLRAKSGGWRIVLSPGANYYHPDLFAKYGMIDARPSRMAGIMDWVKPRYMPLYGRDKSNALKPLAILMVRHSGKIGGSISAIYSLIRNLASSPRRECVERARHFCREIREGGRVRPKFVSNWREMVDYVRLLDAPQGDAGRRLQGPTSS